MDKITHEVRKEQWKAMIEECLASGLSKAAWCKQNGISDKTFYYWQRVLRKEAYLQMQEEKKELLPIPTAETLKPMIPFVELKQPETTVESLNFKPDVVIRSNHLTIEISNTASDKLLVQLGGLLHAK